MVQVTQNTEFIIGIDFGHGETSAAFYNIKNQKKKDLDILPGKKVVKSAVAILEQEGKETICIGDAAIENAPLAKDFQIAFKKRPSEMNKTERNRMVAFMKGVYAEILNIHPDYKTRQHVVYIARPSQDKLWESEEDAYLKIAEDAGLPVAGIQKESRAAYFRARTQPDSKIDTQVKNGVLIVDFGSSTIDFTYLSSKLSKPIDDGCPLGASEVENTLLKYAMDNPSDCFMPEFVKLYGNSKESNPYNQMLYKFREAKERFYGNKLPMFSVSFDYGLLTSSETTPIYGFGGITIPKDKINTILGQNNPNGYIWKVKEAVKSFKENKLKDNKVTCVYLTGGASRMDFVRQIFMDTFNLDEAHCPSDDEPSVIVSEGVAHLSYADIKTKNIELQLKQKIDNLLSNFSWYSTISEIIHESVKNEIKLAAHSIMVKWRDGDIYEVDSDNKICNLNALKHAFENLFLSFNNVDFIKKSAQAINENLINSIVAEIKKSFANYYYDETDIEYLTLPTLSAILKQSGIQALTNKFIAYGKGHIIYDSIASRNICMKDHLNMKIVRFEEGRKSHYNQYPYCIFNDSEWNTFLNEHLCISGIESIIIMARNYAYDILYKYANYAKLASFYKS